MNLIGNIGENIACNYLEENDYKILERNFKNNFGKNLGEIDIIAKNGDCYIFIEVKTRSNSNSIPEENINKNKLRKILKIINIYLSKNKLWDVNWRIDAISIILNKDTQRASLRHLKNIFL